MVVFQLNIDTLIEEACRADFRVVITCKTRRSFVRTWLSIRFRKGVNLP